MSGSRTRALRRRRLCFREVRRGRDGAAAVLELAARPTKAPRFLAILFVALCIVGSSGCAELGDFKRPRASVWNDSVLPTTGSLAALARGEPVSLYAFTDDEEELRARAWHFVMPAKERFWFEATLADLVRTRILPLSLRPASRAAYHRALMRAAFRSPASRYQRISEDAFADLALVGPFAGTALRVMGADEVRLRSLVHIRDATGPEIDHAVARVTENRCLIAWVRHEMRARLQSYHYALERLLVEAPQNEAISVERSLAALEGHAGTLDTLAPPIPNVLCDELDLQAHSLIATPLIGITPAPEPLVVKN